VGIETQPELSLFEGEYIAYQDIAFHSAFALSSGALPEMTAFAYLKRMIIFS